MTSMRPSVVLGFVAVALLGAAALSAAALLLGTVIAPAGSGPATGKCSSAKIKCANGKATGLLGCYGKAEGKGIPVDTTCTGKVDLKFSDPTTMKGCMEKAEAKPPCVTTGDASALENKVDAFVTDVVSTIDNNNPTPPLSKCAAGQKKCVANKVKADLGCYGKAAKAGTAVDPTCLGKADTKFADPMKGCMAKLELKTPNDCITTGQTATLEGKVDTFSLGVFNEEVPGTTTTTTTTGSTTTTTPLTVTVGPGGQLVFDPATLTIKVGDTVHWVWATAGHSVVSGTNGTTDNQFCSPNNTSCGNPPLSLAGATYDHTFTTAGTFPYYCSVHFSLGMTGTITVQ
jgi:plastocyanin